MQCQIRLFTLTKNIYVYNFKPKYKIFIHPFQTFTQKSQTKAKQKGR